MPVSSPRMSQAPATSRVALFIEPATRHFLSDRLFADNGNLLGGDRIEAPYVHLREACVARGVEVHTSDYLPEFPDDVLKLYVSLGGLQGFESLCNRRDVILSAFFALECPIVEPSLYRALPRVARRFRRVYSWSDSASLRRFTGADVPLRPFRWPQSFDDVHEQIWAREDRKFLVMINANKLPRIYWQELYTERMRAVEFFDRTGEIDLYGNGWEGPSMRVGRTWVPWTIKKPWLDLQRVWDRIHPPPLLAAARRAYRGPASTKAEVLGQYTFALCFENSILRGWITEKLFDCFFAGTIPIYWGAPEIEDIVPPDCFIDMRKFSGYEDLRRFLCSLTAVDIRRYRLRARDFLHSPQFQPFSRAAFTAHFLSILAEEGALSASGT